MSSGTIYGPYYGGSSNVEYNMRLGMQYTMEPKTWDDGKTWYCRVTVYLHFLSSSIQVDGMMKNGTVTINGKTQSFQATVPNTYNNSIVTGNRISSMAYDIPYNSDGTGSCSIGGSYSIQVTYSGVWIDTMYISGNLTFPPVSVTPGIAEPGDIYNFQVWGNFESKDYVHLWWEPASNTTHYYIYVRYYNYKTGSYYPNDSEFSWVTTVTTNKADIYFDNVANLQYDACYFVLKTCNIVEGVGSSVNPKWQGGGIWVWRKPTRIYIDGQWKLVQPSAYIENAPGSGTGWAPTIARIWNGSEWILPG